MMTASADGASDTSSFLLESGRIEAADQAPGAATTASTGWSMRSRRMSRGMSQEARSAAMIGTGFLAIAVMAIVAYQAETSTANGPIASKSPVSLVAVEGTAEDPDDLALELPKDILSLDLPGVDDDDDDKKQSSGSPSCQEAASGTQCFKDITYARRHISAHPDWYVGLHKGSSIKAFQAFLHKQHTNTGKPRCPKPCGHVEMLDKHMLDGKCHTATTGEDCYNHVLYTMKENLPNHPEWYPGLAEDAGFKTVQAYLHKQRVCPMPCGIVDKRKKKSDCRHLKGKAKDTCEEENDFADEMSHCHTAFAGEACYGDVLWAMDHVTAHPDWYPGLANESGFSEFQAFLHKQHNGNVLKLCPQPCNETAVKAVKHIDVKHHCHTAVPGESCYKSVVWVIEEGIIKHPEWYENMTADATFEEVQKRLNKDKDSDCKRSPCPCHTAEKGEKCYDSIQWVYTTGFTNHSSWYKGLNTSSSFEDVQARLHEDAHPTCPMPCQKTPWEDKPEDEDTGDTTAGPADA